MLVDILLAARAVADFTAQVDEERVRRQLNSRIYRNVRQSGSPTQTRAPAAKQEWIRPNLRQLRLIPRTTTTSPRARSRDAEAAATGASRGGAARVWRNSASPGFVGTSIRPSPGLQDCAAVGILDHVLRDAWGPGRPSSALVCPEQACILSDCSCPREPSDDCVRGKSVQIANYVGKRQLARPHPADGDLVDNAAAR